jgi:hypothetical protein
MNEDIKITEGTILESLNNKADIDGGNYKGSGLQAVLEETTLGTTGGTLTGPLVINTNGDNMYRNLSLRFTSVDFDTPPSSAIYPSLELQDEQGRRMGRVEYTYKTDGSHHIGIIDKKNADTASYASIFVGYDASGNVISGAPACTATNSIVTTTGISKAANGYVKLGNGIIIQWGRKTYSSDTFNHEDSITLPIAFTTTNYTVAVTSYATNPPQCGYASRSTTKFTLISTRDGGSAHTTENDWIAIGY